MQGYSIDRVLREFVVYHKPRAQDRDFSSHWMANGGLPRDDPYFYFVGERSLQISN